MLALFRDLERAETGCILNAEQDSLHILSHLHIRQLFFKIFSFPWLSIPVPNFPPPSFPTIFFFPTLQVVLGTMLFFLMQISSSAFFPWQPFPHKVTGRIIKTKELGWPSLRSAWKAEGRLLGNRTGQEGIHYKGKGRSMRMFTRQSLHIWVGAGSTKNTQTCTCVLGQEGLQWAQVQSNSEWHWKHSL